MATHQGSYYVPEYSMLPFFTALGLFFFGFGTINLFQTVFIGKLFFILGSIIIAAILFAWFRSIILEGKAGYYGAQVDRSFRWGMIWFIFSETALFGILLFALIYARLIIVPSLGGEYGTSASTMTHLLLWPNFKPNWPVLMNPNAHAFITIKNTFNTWGIPALNTLILLISSATITWAHWNLRANLKAKVIIGVVLTILLGLVFLGLQIYEFMWGVQGFKLSSGIYGNTFFMLTGFHAAHVMIGLGMLTVSLFLFIRGHFTPDAHFGFEATTWYWNFVDLIWLVIFVMVYWL